MERQVSYSVANFAAKFCNELGTDKTSICSPLSAEIMLALLALGCKNQSHDELLKALDMTDDDAIRSSYGFLTSTLKSVQDAALNVANKERKPDDKYANNIFQFSLDQLDFIGNESAAANINNWVLNVANKVYLKKGGELKPDIEKDARNVFQSSLDQLDFIEKEAAAATINNWVAQQTNNKIKDIVSPDMMSEDTRVVLVNAIYFQGLWVKPFYASATKNRSFRVNERTTIQVPMMSLTETYFDYGVSKELKAKLLRMKYQGGQASMVIVLPDEVEGLKSVLQKLASGHNIMTDIESMRSTDLDIVIPKFKVETTIDLKKLLPNLGIKSIFDAKNADIDMLKSNEKLFVSDAIQKALIIVDENGTKAAACTGSKFGGQSWSGGAVGGCSASLPSTRIHGSGNPEGPNSSLKSCRGSSLSPSREATPIRDLYRFFPRRCAHSNSI
ncbi:serine protease inhibitor 3/4-like isoform X1 [Choristoneura fumiferana]|uniref:serine protease inhibitor 3/4-like isoform X1 n=1 Tax=Choristoneura fumiferana TaxID=7141 RepID=UPI003D15ED13